MITVLYNTVKEIVQYCRITASKKVKREDETMKHETARFEPPDFYGEKADCSFNHPIDQYD